MDEAILVSEFHAQSDLDHAVVYLLDVLLRDFRIQIKIQRGKVLKHICMNKALSLKFSRNESSLFLRVINRLKKCYNIRMHWQLEPSCVIFL